MDKIFYSETHEYLRLIDNETAEIGITDFAQKSLGNIVYVDMPEVGDEFAEGGDFGAIESVKAASDLIIPVSGEIIEVNEALADNPRLINQDAMANWIIKVRLSDPAELDALMDFEAYEQYVTSESH